MLSSQLVLEISEIKNEHEGNHPRFTLDKNPKVWLILKLYKIPGSPTVRSERTQRRRKTKRQGEDGRRRQKNRRSIRMEKIRERKEKVGIEYIR